MTKYALALSNITFSGNKQEKESEITKVDLLL